MKRTITFSENLKYYRTKQQLPQKQLAEQRLEKSNWEIRKAVSKDL